MRRSKSHLGVGVDEGLLVNPPHAIHVDDVEGVLRAEITRMGSLDLATFYLLLPLALERSDLLLGNTMPSSATFFSGAAR